jgi:hypothetical protein
MGVVVKGRCGRTDGYRVVYVLGIEDRGHIRGQMCGLSIVVEFVSYEE